MNCVCVCGVVPAQLDCRGRCLPEPSETDPEREEHLSGEMSPPPHKLPCGGEAKRPPGETAGRGEGAERRP